MLLSVRPCEIGLGVIAVLLEIWRTGKHIKQSKEAQSAKLANVECYRTEK